MDVATISLPPDVVEARLAAYARHDDYASAAIKTALSALQAGLMVVDLRTVFHAAMRAEPEQATTAALADAGAGLPGESRPARIRLTPSVAIAPASRGGHQIQLTVRGSGELQFRTGAWRFTVPQTLRTSESRRVLDRWVERVPQIPAFLEVRPSDLVLWEANWTRVPPSEYDPSLLEPIAGWLYLVRETWDLTEVERAVLV
jgi:hypothetical protein